MPVKLAIVLAVQGALKPHSHGEFSRVERHALPVLRDRHVWQQRLWDPVTEGAAFNTTFDKLFKDHRYEPPYEPRVLIVEVPDAPSAANDPAVVAITDLQPPTDFASALAMLPLLDLAPEDKNGFVLSVTGRLQSLQELARRDHAFAIAEALKAAQPPAETPSQEELLNQTGDIPDEVPEPEPEGEGGKSEVVSPEPETAPVAEVVEAAAPEEAPAAGELEIPEPVAEPAAPAPAKPASRSHKKKTAH